MIDAKQQLNESYISRFIIGQPIAFYDIGVGPKTEWETLKGIFPQMRVYGCEPNPPQYEKLKSLFPGELLNIAISDTEGEFPLYVSTDDPKTSCMFPMAYCSKDLLVPTWTLDHFDKHFGSPDKILLWMDIEGYEYKALKGGEELMRSGRVRWINLEESLPAKVVPEEWPTPQEIRELLEDYGYRRLVPYNHHRTHQDALYFHKDEPARKVKRK